MLSTEVRNMLTSNDGGGGVGETKYSVLISLSMPASVEAQHRWEWGLGVRVRQSVIYGSNIKSIGLSLDHLCRKDLVLWLVLLLDTKWKVFIFPV